MTEATPVTMTMMTEIRDMTTDPVRRKKSKKLRHELKYNISAHDDLVLSARLRKLFDHDGHAGSHGSYRVSSLYFDTPYDKALADKLAGVRKREKFRIRYYDSDMSFMRLEKKYKIGELCAKHSTGITKEQTDMILAGNADSLLSSGDELMQELYSKIKGQLLSIKTLVSYEREAFIYAPGNVRITIDRKLSAYPVRGHTEADGVISGDRLIDMSAAIRVLEIKYDEFIPDIVRMAAALPSGRRVAYSKYAESRRYE